ncbi:MAG: N-acetyltransferase [Rubellimicrobium sp.]|nr:N-acetyltransferase [Rubellimicrobium sp.]
MTAAFDITLHRSIAGIAQAEWDACACPEAADGGRPFDPFTTWRFLHLLEDSGSVGPGTGWLPHHLAARRNGVLAGVAPLYLKSHSQGEYIFDFNWAHAWERAGGRYYPKMQIAVPFTPVTGRRLLTRPGHDDARAALLDAAVRLAEGNDLSSLHVTFCTADEAQAGAALGLMPRLSEQYHWHDAGYGDFEGFLAALSSRKRKAIRRERREAQAFGGQIVALTGAGLTRAHWDAMWRFYQDTGARKWGSPYLTRAFFDLAAERLADDALMVLALRDGRPVAGALNFIGRAALFGRYWGASEHHPFLHFEICYHRAIDWALAHGLQRVEAGAQGEHKIARGYLPVQTHSLHWIADPGFRAAVVQFLQAEAGAVEEEVEVLTALGPFRRDRQEDSE